MSLDLSPEVERIVRERAAAEGVSVNDLLARAFASGNGGAAARARVQALLALWQSKDRTQALPASNDAAGRVTAGDTLLEHWRKQDAAMSEAEQDAEDRLWEDVTRGIDDTRVRLGMRTLRP